MNTAVPILNHRHFPRKRTQSTTFSIKNTMQIILLISTVLLSAFAVVYIKDLHRRLFIQYQLLEDKQNQLIVDWGKLLLEQSTWSTQARVQAIAESRLNMEVPQANEVQMIEY